MHGQQNIKKKLSEVV